MKYKREKLRKLEKSRYSILTSNLKKCYVCNSTFNIELNELFAGAFRQRSMLHGAVIPMCHSCHKDFHDHFDMQLFYQQEYQREFEKAHSRDEFISIFMKSRL